MTLVWEILTSVQLILLVFLVYFIERRTDKRLKRLEKTIKPLPLVDQPKDQQQPFVCPECKINDELILISEEKEMWYCETCQKMIKKR
jgi:hypothetical protein